MEDKDFEELLAQQENHDEEEEYELHRHWNTDGTFTEKMIKRPKKAPNLLQNFKKTTQELLINGFAPKDLAEERLAICVKCEYLLPNSTCSLCGCFMQAKTKVAGAECPKGKWQAMGAENRLWQPAGSGAEKLVPVSPDKPA